jgi:DNA-binding NtrC family response regulator
MQVPLVSYSAEMRGLLATLTRHAATEVRIVLVAERGLPGPELAQLVHARSSRAAQPFVIGECAALRPEQSAAWLFGVPGDAAGGMLRLAAEGTLLLCDLPALPRDVQAALVRALRERRVTLGEDDGYACGARLLATCRRDPEALVAEGALDPELLAFFAAHVRVPPLRERSEDLPSLILFALDSATRVLGRPAVGLEPAAQQRLVAHDWPGNLDELHAVIELAVARCNGSRITLGELPAFGPKPAATKDSGHPLDGTLERVEKRVLQRALERTNGNKSEAARLLGLPRTTFLDKLRRYDLDDGSPSARGTSSSN